MERRTGYSYGRLSEFSTALLGINRTYPSSRNLCWDNPELPPSRCLRHRGISVRRGLSLASETWTNAAYKHIRAQVWYCYFDGGSFACPSDDFRQCCRQTILRYRSDLFYSHGGNVHAGLPQIKKRQFAQQRLFEMNLHAAERIGGLFSTPVAFL